MMQGKPQTPNYQRLYDAIGEIADKGGVYTHRRASKISGLTKDQVHTSFAVLKKNGMIKVAKLSLPQTLRYHLLLEDGRETAKVGPSEKKRSWHPRVSPVADIYDVAKELMDRRIEIEEARKEHVRKCLEAESAASPNRKAMGVMMTRYLAMKEKYA